MDRSERSESPADSVPYIDLIAEGDIVQTLRSQIEDAQALLATIPEDRADHRYAPHKWSIKELVGHLVDAERIFPSRSRTPCC